MAEQTTIKVDLTSINKLAQDMGQANELAIRRIAERGEQHLRDEVPRDTNNLAEGISSDVRILTSRYEADLIVSARSGRRGARQAKVHYPSGNTKDIRLKPQPAFDYAEVAARGRKAIRPKRGRALLIPVSSKPATGSYITSGNQTFVVRRSARATKGNPYDQRAAAKLEREVTVIVTTQYEKFGVVS